MENPTHKLIVTTAQDSESFSVMGGNYRVLISGKQTNGAFAVIEMLVPPNGGPGPHAHKDINESFYIVDGEIEVKSKDLTYTAQKGDYIDIPFGGMVHSFKNRSENLARIICTVTPAGMDEMFEEIGQPVAAGTFLPPPQISPELAAKMKEIGNKYGQEFFPPDYLD
ncbi:cupin domain-containing protein [Mucilaginibacter glaciei]|uniref:Cupin domain-containing protein n=1 Tax=Mucilaginibacter glaciei TaxID=2772109 RepID=A0A926S1C3_9SPHI|nr:cupin domain-containing protein [Mucilaginibacter glaciei]MBD1392004.1 cupin domain-containing protein [Mucilaginibacter glaciei]